jgi:hypothetical protein
LAGGLGALAASPYVVARAAEDQTLFNLAEELGAANHTLQAAVTELARAERRLARVAETSTIRDLPEWFLAREEAEAAAKALMESLKGRRRLSRSRRGNTDSRSRLFSEDELDFALIEEHEGTA